jgi:hypothetical protein
MFGKKTYIWHGRQIELSRTTQQFGFCHPQGRRALVVPSHRRRGPAASGTSAVTAAAEPDVQNIVADHGRSVGVEIERRSHGRRSYKNRNAMRYFFDKEKLSSVVLKVCKQSQSFGTVAHDLCRRVAKEDRYRIRDRDLYLFTQFRVFYLSM